MWACLPFRCLGSEGGLSGGRARWHSLQTARRAGSVDNTGAVLTLTVPCPGIRAGVSPPVARPAARGRDSCSDAVLAPKAWVRSLPASSVLLEKRIFFHLCVFMVT